MRIEISPYVLEPYPEFFKSSRQGALLKVTFEEGLTGYADFHPWPELGDLPLFKHLQVRDSPLFQRSLHYAKLDAEARQKGVSLFHHLSCPPSHLMLPSVGTLRYLEEGLSQGFTRFKMKVGLDPEKEISQINKLIYKLIESACKLRLDFNERLKRNVYISFMENLKAVWPYIDFCEDPFPYDAKAWEDEQRQHPLNLACDKASSPQHDIPKVQVIKPAKEDPSPYFNGQKNRLIITSYLDHPVGQLCAAYEAALHKERLDTCGLMSHLVYRKNKFSEKLSYGTPYFSAPQGPGLGFDEEFRQIPWIRL